MGCFYFAINPRYFGLFLVDTFERFYLGLRGLSLFNSLSQFRADNFARVCNIGNIDFDTIISES
jgi:hypothetical protein